MDKFTIFWLDGTRQVIEGDDITDAFNKNYSAGALAAMDFYSSGDNKDYKWNKVTKTWSKLQV